MSEETKDTTTTAPELSACPFCGCLAEARREVREPDCHYMSDGKTLCQPEAWWRVWCSGCRANGPGPMRTFGAVRQLWNRRFAATVDGSATVIEDGWVVLECDDDGDGGLLTDPCPFCGDQHYHGSVGGEGHRLAHCSSKAAKEITEMPDGVTVKAGGYFLRSRHAATTERPNR